MKYDVERGSGAMIYIRTKFHKDCFRHLKADRGDTEINRKEM
jgi:hypothetical protein